MISTNLHSEDNNVKNIIFLVLLNLFY